MIRPSNIAVPKYYAKFRQAVIDGKEPVCREISQEMNRIDALINNPRYYYNPSKVDGWIKYCENELCLTDGSPLRLLDSFKLWGEEIFGWYRLDEVQRFNKAANCFVREEVLKRLTKKQALIVGRGAAKTMYGSTIHSYFQNIDSSATHQIATSPTMKQSEEMLSPLRTAILRPRGPYHKLLTMGSIQNTTGNRAYRQQLCSTKKGIENFMNGSIIEVLPMTIDKLQGYRPKVTTIDEWLSGDIREDVIGAIEQGAGKNNYGDYLIVFMSSEGTVRNGPGDTVKMELKAILEGEYYAPHISVFYYRLDDSHEINDPNLWVKANPNIGKTIQYEAYFEDIERMKIAPSTRNDILAKRFGIPSEGYTYFFNYEETLPPEPKRDYWKMPCSLGADLSRGDDFCAFTFLFPLSNGKFGIKARSYITMNTFMKISPAMHSKYEDFIREGTLIVMEGTVLDMMEVYEDLDAHIVRNEYDVISFGFDPYNAKDFVMRWEKENGPFGIEKVIQGARTESVPLGELKKLAENRCLLFDEEIMTFCMGNCITREDTNGNRKLLKRRNDEKIDNVAAMMDAFVAYKINRDAFE